MKKDHQSENSSGLEYADSIRIKVDIHFLTNGQGPVNLQVIRRGIEIQK